MRTMRGSLATTVRSPFRAAAEITPSAVESMNVVPTRSTTTRGLPAPESSACPSSSAAWRSSSPCTDTTVIESPTRATVMSGSSSRMNRTVRKCRCARLRRCVAIRSHRDELVADAANGHELLGPLRVALDLAAQVRHVDVARALVADVRAVPQVLHHLAAREDLLGLAGEEREQLELRRREPDRLPLRLHRVADGVDLEAADPHDRAARRAEVELAAA